MAQNEELKSLKTRRATIKGSVTRISKFANEFPADGNIFQLKTRLGNLREAFREFDTVQSRIEVLDEAALDATDREDFENSYYNVESNILTILENATINEAAVNTNATAFTPTALSINGASNVRLPILELTTFNGNFMKWLSFRDTFKALVHDNNVYSNIEKFHYLRSCLKEEALKAIEPIAVSEANYKTAWDTLTTRFENKRLIIQEHAYAIINLPPLVKNSYQSIRKLTDDLNINLAALKTLGEPTENWLGLLIPVVSQKFDYFTKREWETQLDAKPPTLEEFKDFLKKKCLTLESLSVAENQNSRINNTSQKSNNKVPTNAGKPRTLCNASINKLQCHMCKESHGLYQCTKFLNLTITQRITQVKNLKICENCFKKGHDAQQCKSRGCRYCNVKHNSLLHGEVQVQGDQVTPTTSTATSIVAYSSFGDAKQNLLATAEILIKDVHGNWQQFRALLDPGSQSNFISEEAIQALGIKTKPVNWPISMVEGVQGCARQITNIHFKSVYNPFNTHISCLVLDKITEDLPLTLFEFDHHEIPGNINLADPTFNISRKVDVLLGSAIFWRILGVGQIKANRQSPHFQETILGWVVGGDIATGNKPNVGTLCNVSLNTINNKLSKFWELDEYPTSDRVVVLKQEDIECETHFKNSFSRNAEGRFMVEIPFKLNGPNLGVSKDSHKTVFVVGEEISKEPHVKERVHRIYE